MAKSFCSGCQHWVFIQSSETNGKGFHYCNVFDRYELRLRKLWCNGKLKGRTIAKAEQFIKDYTRGCSNELCAVEDRYGKKVVSYHEWLTPEQALAALKIAKGELIEKACEWLDDNLHHYWGSISADTHNFLFDFRKAMEE